MKYLLALSLVLSLTACSKKQGSSAPTFAGTKPVTGGGSSVIIDPNDPNGSQVQTDGTTVQKPYTSMNVDINYAKQGATITIKKKDAAKLFNRLAIKTEGKEVAATKTAKHIKCSINECTLKIDLKDAVVIANEAVGDRVSKRLPSLLPYKGDNLRINNLKKVGEIFVEGMDAETLFKAIAVKEVVKANDKDILEKIGVGEAGMTCSQTTDAEESKVSYRCSVRFSVVDGTVIAPK